MSGNPKRADLIAAVGLVVLVCALFCHVYGRWDAEAWATPTAYGGDGWYTLAYLKAARDGHVVPLRSLEVPELNAPTGASWNDFLRQHKLQYWLAGLIARRAGIFVTANLLLLLAHLLAALSFYAVARRLRIRREWSLLGAALFAASPFLFWRSLGHLTLTMCWTIPLCVLVVGWCFSSRGLEGRLGAAMAVAALQGVHNIYFSALFAQLLLLASLVQAARGRGRRAMGPVVLLLVLAAATAADNANMLAARWHQGPNPDAAQRPFGNLERFALKPVELVFPTPGSGLLRWGNRTAAYWSGTLYRGERGSAYLGLAGVAGLAWLVMAGAWRRRLTAPLAAVLWILGFSVVGGGNAVLGTFGFVFLRATSRYSVWILVLVLLFLVGRLSRASVFRWRAAGVAAAAVVAAVGLADQLPPRLPPAAVDSVRATVESDRRFVEAIEARLPPGAMVFMLPVMSTPEGQAILKVADYEHYRPYLFSSRLRFSYGEDKGRGRDAWQGGLIDVPAEFLISTLERRSFSGLIVNTKGFEGRGLLEELAAAGRPPTLESADGQLVFVSLGGYPPPR